MLENEGPAEIAEEKVIEESIVRMYTVSGRLRSEIDRRFTTQAVTPEQQYRIDVIRTQARAFASSIAAYLPPSREQAEALTCLETATMYAVAGIAREPQKAEEQNGVGAHIEGGGYETREREPGPTLADAKVIAPDFEVSRR